MFDNEAGHTGPAQVMPMHSLWQRMRTGFVEVVYPPTCAGCGARGMWLCDDCQRVWPPLDRGICHRCGAPVQPLCTICANLDPVISMARSAYVYGDWVPHAIRRFKYGEESGRGVDLVDRMAWVPPLMGEFDVIVPVPLHRDRLRERGYNQSALLAEGLGERLGVPVRPFVERARATTPQAKLDREDRQSNVQGAFRLNPALAPESGLRVLLVDDVRTTGATLNACAQVLVPCLPARICVATFALDLTERHLNDWRAEYAT